MLQTEESFAIKKKEENCKNHYLIYVTRYDIFTNGKKVDVYEYEGDVFHAMGEIQYRSEVQIHRIDYAQYTEAKVAYWLKEGFVIRTWRDKYPILEGK